MKHKKLFVSLTAVFSVIIFLAVFLMIWYLGDSYKDFESFKKEFSIEQGLKDGAVPQGMGTCIANYTVEEDGKEVTKTQQYYFVSAYMNDGSPSRIYVTGEKTGYVGYVTMKNVDGSLYYGHCGGLAINNNSSISSSSAASYYTLWVTGEGNVYVAKSDEAYKNAKKSIAQEIVEKAARIPLNPSEEGDNTEYDYSIRFTSSFNANCNASFCFYYDDPATTSDRLYVGEFYREGNYETDKKHWFTTPNGYLNKAVMYEYTVSTSSTNNYGLSILSESAGVETRVPQVQRIFSIPEQIQGIAFSGRKSYSDNVGSTLVLSQSYGLSNSHLLCFDFAKVMATANSEVYKTAAGESFVYEGVKRKTESGIVADSDYTDSGNTLRIYYVDKADEDMFVRDYSIPCMSEAMCVVPPASSNQPPSYRVYVLFESGSKKYGSFVRKKLKNVYSFLPSY